MSHVRLWCLGCLELPFTPGGQVFPCYSLVNMTTAIRAAWLAAWLVPAPSLSPLLSQQQCSTQGTWPHSPITVFPGASKCWGGGGAQAGRAPAPLRHWEGCSFLSLHLCVISARWGMSLRATWLAPPLRQPLYHQRQQACKRCLSELAQRHGEVGSGCSDLAAHRVKKQPLAKGLLR